MTQDVRMHKFIGLGALALSTLLLGGAGPAAPANGTSSTSATAHAHHGRPVEALEPATADPRFAHDYLLHLPGIAGEKWVDHQMLNGLRDAGYAGQIEIYDWTGNDPGLRSLMAYERNHAEARKVARRIIDRFRADPSVRITLTAHSGGTGLAVWALEDLPADVKVQQVVLFASALSPGYDLSKALTHVRGTFYSFCSENDVLVLGAGTRMFGTIDGVKTESAGEYGFIMPTSADRAQYAKLVQKPYDKDWMQYGNIGDHIGPMRRAFSSHVIAPMLFGAILPPTANAAAGSSAHVDPPPSRHKS